MKEKENLIITLITIACVFLVVTIIFSLTTGFRTKNKTLKVGFVYVGDESTPYTDNFIKAQRELKAAYGDDIEILVDANVNEEDGETFIRDLAGQGCDIIFTTSYGYGEYAKKVAKEYPDIEFCQATCSNTDEDTPNYHTFMGKIHEGRYVAGVVAGLKIKEMIENKEISENNAVIGYVGAFPNAEVISGFTSFFLGARSVEPAVTMKVRYTESWGNYGLEKICANKLIDEGCVIISQHSDTIGPAVACENAETDHPVYHVGYNQSMVDVAPTTSLISTRINWNKYILGAVDAVFNKKSIEETLDADIYGLDAGAGFEKDWVQMVELNSIIAPDGAKDVIDETIKGIINGDIKVFKGDFTGVNPDDLSDTIDLSQGFVENATGSAPSFYYILDDVITVEE